MRAARVPLQPVRGMKEVFRNYPVFHKIVSSFDFTLKDDYQHIIPNIVENEATFTKGLGVQSDIVLKEMYRIQSPSGSESDMVLRPEGTASVLRTLLND